MNLSHQTAPALDVTRELFDELRITGATLCARRLLLTLRHRDRDREEVADVEGCRLDQHVLVTFQPVELTREPVQAFGDGRLALVLAVRRKE